jgi:hypothetical protein
MDEILTRKINRRRFIAFASLFLAAGSLSCSLVQNIAGQFTNKISGKHSTNTPPDGSIYPEPQRLQALFTLTPTNAQIFWVFIANRSTPLGRRAIAGQFNISSNTLKDHITRIIRHVQAQGYPEVTTLNQAVSIAADLLA